jgi:CDP-paratose 2-epimerase
MYIYLITGGAGFVGSSLAIRLKEDRNDVRVIAMDNLLRRGSELNLSRLKACGVEFLHGDVRNSADLELDIKVDCIIECAAEPSILAGYHTSPKYVTSTNLVGTLNCLELARRDSADFIFLSSSRVYPYSIINALKYQETPTRYELHQEQDVAGVSENGFSEEFPLTGLRSLYGATKLASELIIQEYLDMYKLRGVINRCGVLTGPWQMGKVDQGFVTLWVARHIFGGDLNYLGFEGVGKQVRDILHVDDLYQLLKLQLDRLDDINGQVYNVGGGREVSVSLSELTSLCHDVTGKSINVIGVPEPRPADILLYLSDFAKVKAHLGWMPQKPPIQIVDEIAKWISDNKALLSSVLG